MVQVELEHDGSSGAARPRRSTTAARRWSRRSSSWARRARSGDDPFALEAIEERLGRDQDGGRPRGARRGAPRLDRPAARACRSGGCSACRARRPPTSYTIGIDTRRGHARPGARARGYAVAEGEGRRPRRSRAARGRPRGVGGAAARGRQRGLDARGGARELVPALVELGVELIEQPFPAEDLDSFRALRELEPRPPVVVDEGCHDLRDVAARGRLRRRDQRQARQVPAACGRRCGWCTRPVRSDCG